MFQSDSYYEVCRIDEAAGRNETTFTPWHVAPTTSKLPITCTRSTKLAIQLHEVATGGLGLQGVFETKLPCLYPSSLELLFPTQQRAG